MFEIYPDAFQIDQDARLKFTIANMAVSDDTGGDTFQALPHDLHQVIEAV